MFLHLLKMLLVIVDKVIYRYQIYVFLMLHYNNILLQVNTLLLLLLVTLKKAY